MRLFKDEPAAYYRTHKERLWDTQEERAQRKKARRDAKRAARRPR